MKRWSIIVIDDQQEATILVYTLIPNQLYMFRAIFLPIVRNTWLYSQLLTLSTDIVASWCHDTSRQQYRMDNTRSCKYSQVLLMVGENFARNIYSWLGINKKVKIDASFWSSLNNYTWDARIHDRHEHQFLSILKHKTELF